MWGFRGLTPVELGRKARGEPTGREVARSGVPITRRRVREEGRPLLDRAAGSRFEQTESFATWMRAVDAGRIELR